MSNNDPLKEKDDVVTKNVEIKVSEIYPDQTTLHKLQSIYFGTKKRDSLCVDPGPEETTETNPVGVSKLYLDPITINLDVEELETLCKALDVDISTLYPATYEVKHVGAFGSCIVPTLLPPEIPEQSKEVTRRWIEDIDIATLYPEMRCVEVDSFGNVPPLRRMKTYAQIKESLQSLTEDIGPDPLFPQLAEPHLDQVIIGSKFAKRHIATRRYLKSKNLLHQATGRDLTDELEKVFPSEWLYPTKREKYSLAVKQRTPSKKKLCRYKRR